MQIPETRDIDRPPAELIRRLADVPSATATGQLQHLGIGDAHISGPSARTPGAKVVGPALTLQFMPQREDQYSADEYDDPEVQLHRHCLYHTQPGDVVVVDARGSLSSGVFDELFDEFYRGLGIRLALVISGPWLRCMLFGNPR